MFEYIYMNRAYYANGWQGLDWRGVVVWLLLQNLLHLDNYLIREKQAHNHVSLLQFHKLEIYLGYLSLSRVDLHFIARLYLLSDLHTGDILINIFVQLIITATLYRYFSFLPHNVS